MSGYIDQNGVQWERCTQCAAWERYELLAYAPRNPALPRPLTDDGACVDLCRECVAGTPWTGKHRDQALNLEPKA